MLLPAHVQMGCQIVAVMSNPLSSNTSSMTADVKFCD